jgi:type 1 glutamine amidotransferase
MVGRVVLVVSKGLVHPSPFSRAAFAAAVRGAGFAAEFHASTRAFRGLAPERHEAAAAFFHTKSIRAADIDALEAFVTAGGGLFAVHGAFASCKAEPRWAALLGAAFDGHERPTLLAVGPSADPGPFAGIPAFAATDELYRIRPVGPIVPWFSATPARGGTMTMPILWTRSHGRGRVCCFSLGHAAAVLRLPAARQIIARALAWVSATGEVRHGA